MRTGMQAMDAPSLDDRVFAFSSALAPQGELLAHLERNAARNYFRLLNAYERLGQISGFSRTAAQPRNLGALLSRELERERSRIARELHAGAGQPLAGIKLNLDLIRSACPDLPAGVSSRLARLDLLADQALEQVRALSHRLYPPDWQQLGIREAIEKLLQSSGVAERFKVKTELAVFEREPAFEIKVTLYRCCQECLSNIMRHSGAKSLRLSLRDSGPKIALTIEDDGVGFDVERLPFADAFSGGIGLAAMREQVAWLDGALEIQSGLGGTKLEISLPRIEG